MDDRTLLQEYRKTGSEEAFTELVNRYHDMVYSVCMRHIHDPGLARDAAQAVFLALSKNAGNIRKNAVPAWLMKAAKNAAINIIKMEVRRKKHEKEAGHMRQGRSFLNPEWAQVAPVLDDALLSLSEKDRYAVILRYFRDKPHAEIGHVLGMSEDAAQMRVKRAVSKLKKFFSRKGVALSVGILTGFLTENAVEAAPAGSGQACISAVFGKAGGGTISENISAVSKGVMRMMLWEKIKTAACAAFLVLTIAAAALLGVLHAQEGKKNTSGKTATGGKYAVSGCPIVPVPKEYRELGSTIELTEGAAIVIGSKATEPEKYAAERLQKLIHRRFKRKLAVVSQSKADNAAQVIGLGRVSTHGLVKKICTDANIDMAAIAAKSESRDGFAIEAAKGKKVILVAGSNPRGVIYGADVFFDLLRSEGDRIVFPAVSIRDWPSIAWRGWPGRIHHPKDITSADFEVYVRQRINFIDWRPGGYGGSPRTGLAKMGMGNLITEAHKCGILVYATTGYGRGGSTKLIAAARKYFEEFLDLGGDGLWPSFDDLGEGKDSEGFVRMAADLAKERGLPLERLATTPAGRGNYEKIGTKWNRKIAKVSGFDKATFFITTPPGKKMYDTAMEMGLKRPAGWWHNWPRYDSGLMYGCYGGVSLRTEKKNAYRPMVPLEIGWDRPTYDDLRNAGTYCDTAMIWGRLDWYTGSVFSIWAWAPETHDWIRTRLSAYAYVFGHAQSRAALEFDDRLRKITPMFHRRKWSGAGAQPPGWKTRLNVWPPQLKDVKSRPDVLKVIEQMDDLLVKIEKRAPAESMLGPATLKDQFLDPMLATVTTVRSMATIEYPEYKLGREFLNEMKELAFAAKDEELKKRLDEVRSEVLATMDRIDKELGGLKDIGNYVKPWRDAVSGVAFWKQQRENEKQAILERTASFKTDTSADAVKDIDQAPAGQSLAELKPGDWNPVDRETLLWRGMGRKGAGIWAIGPCDVAGKKVLAICCASDLGWGTKAKGKDTTKQCYAEVRAEPAVPTFKGKLILDVFAGHSANDKHWSKARFLEIWAGDRKLWKSDISAKSRAGKAWISIDITEAAQGKKKLPLRIRVEDRGPACGHTFIGPVRLRAGAGSPQEGQ